MIISSRLPRAAIHSPMIVSDSPPEWPGTQAEYPSAVSTKLPPAAAGPAAHADDHLAMAVAAKVHDRRQPSVQPADPDAVAVDAHVRADQAAVEGDPEPRALRAAGVRVGRGRSGGARRARRAGA